MTKRKPARRKGQRRIAEQLEKQAIRAVLKPKPQALVILQSAVDWNAEYKRLNHLSGNPFWVDWAKEALGIAPSVLPAAQRVPTAPPSDIPMKALFGVGKSEDVWSGKVFIRDYALANRILARYLLSGPKILCQMEYGGNVNLNRQRSR